MATDIKGSLTIKLPLMEKIIAVTTIQQVKNNT